MMADDFSFVPEIRVSSKSGTFMDVQITYSDGTPIPGLMCTGIEWKADGKENKFGKLILTCLPATMEIEGPAEFRFVDYGGRPLDYVSQQDRDDALVERITKINSGTRISRNPLKMGDSDE